MPAMQEPVFCDIRRLTIKAVEIENVIEDDKIAAYELEPAVPTKCKIILRMKPPDNDIININSKYKNKRILDVD